jgi:hypothetical protein
VTILIRLTLYIVTLPASSFRLNLLPVPLNAIERGFLVLFPRGIRSPSTIYYHLNLFIHPPPSTSNPPHTHIVPILQSYFSLLLFESIFQGVSQYMPTVSILYIGPFNIKYSPLPLYLPRSIFQKLSVHILVPSTFTSYVMLHY